MANVLRSAAISHPSKFPIITLCTVLIAGCGAKTGSNSVSMPTGNTNVTLLTTSTANDRLTEFNVGFNTIRLINQSGKEIDLLSANEHAEFIHLNGRAQPLLSVSVPEDTYISANATIGPTDFVCLGGASGGRTASLEAAYGYTPDANIKIEVPAPIHVNGTSMALLLDLQVSQSASWATSYCGPTSSFSITPTFKLVASSSTFANAAMTKAHGLDGLVVSVDSANRSFVVNAADGPLAGVDASGSYATWESAAWRINTTEATEFQGVSSLSGITIGMPVNLDATLQTDGSLLASRVAVADLDTSILSVFSGPLVKVMSSEPVLKAAGTEQYGYFSTRNGSFLGATSFSFANADFKISDEISNVQQLPFVAKFDNTTMASGQTISITWHATGEQPDSGDIPAATIMLLPQTINGTVRSIASAGDFDIYTIRLAPYDLFPQFAVQLLQSTVLNDPSTVVVYADHNARLLNTQAISIGNPFRFRGAIFNDRGALKMDCVQINDGVVE
jgi:hypothetical protein